MATTTDPTTCLSQLQNSQLLCPDRCGTPVYWEEIDKDGDSCPDWAENICGIDGAAPSSYYGTSAGGTPGIWPLPTNGGSTPGGGLVYPSLKRDTSFTAEFTYLYLVDVTAGAVSVMLPTADAASVNMSLIVMNYPYVDTTNGRVDRNKTITVFPSGTDTINLTSKLSMVYAGESVLFNVSAAGEWSTPLNRLPNSHSHPAGVTITSFTITGYNADTGLWQPTFPTGWLVNAIRAEWAYDLPAGTDPDDQVIMPLTAGGAQFPPLLPSDRTATSVGGQTTSTKGWKLYATYLGLDADQTSYLYFKDMIKYGTNAQKTLSQAEVQDLENSQGGGFELANKTAADFPAQFIVQPASPTVARYICFAVPSSWGTPVVVVNKLVTDAYTTSGPYDIEIGNKTPSDTMSYMGYSLDYPTTEASVLVELQYKF